MAAVTVVVPMYNGERYLRETLHSLVAQDHSETSIVCVDDASTDDSLQIAREFEPHVRVVSFSEHLPIGAHWNRAAALATTPYFAIAHQDDVYERSWISTLAGALDRHPTAFAAHCKAIVIDASGVPVADNPAAAFKERFWPGDGRELLRPPETELQMLTRGNYVIAPSVVYRTDAVRQLGGFDVSFQFVLDWDYWIRGVSRGWRLVGVPQRLLRLRIHPGAKTHAMETTLQRYEEELRLLQTIPQSLRRRYGLVENTVLSAFAERLAAGDSDGAHALHEFARARIPRFSGSARDHLMRLALRIGRAAGRLLVAAERFYLTSTRLSRRR